MAINNVTGAQSIIKAGVCTSATRPAAPFLGQLIFETNDQLQGWDGKFKDVDQPVGVFVWVAVLVGVLVFVGVGVLV